MGQNTTHLEPPPEVIAAISESVGRREFQIYAPPLALEQLRELIALDLGCSDNNDLASEVQVRNIVGTCLFSIPVRQAEPIAA